MITNELLNKFCASELDPRDYLRKPWKENGHVYATQGHYGIRLDSDAGVDAVDKTGAHRADLEALLRKHTAASEYRDIPALPPLQECELCEGRGRVDRIECIDCEGNGSFYHGNRPHEYECQECDGSGNTYSEGANAVCPECEGRREMARPLNNVKIGCATAQVAYLRIIAELPSVKIADGKTALDPLVFTFDGGIGMLMPMRVTA